MELMVEEASAEFLDQLYTLEKLCFDHEAFTKRQLSYFLKDRYTFGLMARLNGEIVGFIIARIESDENTNFGHIITLNVSPKYRRRGVAQRLMNETECILKKKGLDDCCLEVREMNKAALSLYKQLGYKEIARLEGYYGKAHGLYLRKSLSTINL